MGPIRQENQFNFQLVPFNDKLKELDILSENKTHLLW